MPPVRRKYQEEVTVVDSSGENSCEVLDVDKSKTARIILKRMLFIKKNLFDLFLEANIDGGPKVVGQRTER